MPAATSVAAPLQLVHLHRHVEQLLAFRVSQDDFGIRHDAQRLGVDRLAVDTSATV